ncbi:hypothetical protein CJD35_13700 [Sphingobium xenophagum]|uniref:Uncharacterized protein n=1 Tax=Sphingobium xenophagum TaxID=121428 RepID=A0A249MVI0_SPHXE|nr:hypothetical protein [Sphingobium xenophagum]ASY45370.1 hypothetical protein CJD35_13700 [Sphingobium xenophagum]
MAEPYNYAGVLGQAQQLVPNLLDQEIQRSLGRAQVDQAQAQTAMFRQKMQNDLVATRQEQEYSDEVQAALESGDQRRISALIARFPQYKDALKASWDQMDDLQQRSEMRQAAGIWSALNAGDTTSAIKQLEGRITADRQAGQDTADDEEQLALLKSGDPKAVNSVKGKLGLFMASVVPDKFASVVEQLGTGNEGARKGQVVGRAIGHYDENGNWVTDYRDPEPGFTLSEGQTRFEPGTVGGGSSGGSSRGERNGNPGNIKDGPWAQAQPGYIGSDGTFAKFAPGAGAAAQERLLAENYVAKGFDTPAKIVNRYAPAGENSGASMSNYIGYISRKLGIGANDQITQAQVPALAQAMREFETGNTGGGGAVAVASVPKGPGNQARQMTQQEVQAAGLDPAQSWYMQANGIPTAIKGGGQQANGAYSQSALDAFDRAIDTATRLKTHPGLSAAVGVKGLTGGFLGGWVVPGTDAADFGAELDAMKAQVFLPMVQSMKGMGALSNAEGEKLTAAIGALSTKQSEKQFGLSLDRIIKDLRTYKQRGMGGAQSSGAPVKVRSIQEARKLAPGTVFIDPNGVRRVR